MNLAIHEHITKHQPAKVEAAALLAARIEVANKEYKVSAQCPFSDNNNLYSPEEWIQRGNRLERICYRGKGKSLTKILYRISFVVDQERPIGVSEVNLTYALDESDDWMPSYSKWRHGGWYVSNVLYSGGACGCVSNQYPDGKWRIVCDDRRSDLNEPGDFTFRSRDAAARAERKLAREIWLKYLDGASS